jgi:hypothetical protein
MPRLTRGLALAEEIRARQAALHADGVRLAGLEEWMQALDRIQASWTADPQLLRVAFLVRRAIADFETAIEVTLSGFPMVAADMMRDVMEIELLMLNFFVSPDDIDTWLFSTSKVRWKAFRPAVLRARLTDLGTVEELGTAQAEADYRAHSEALHVSPGEDLLPAFSKGLAPLDDPIALDIGFIEMFEHARGFLKAMLLLAGRVSPDSAAAEACSRPLPAFDRAYKRTQDVGAWFRQAVESFVKQITEDLDASDHRSMKDV